MKQAHTQSARWAAAVLASFALLLGSPTAAQAAAPATLSSPLPTPVDATQEFLEKMRKALEIGATDEIAKMVRAQTDAAVWAVIQLCDANSINPSERSEEEINALRIAWKTSMKTRFVEEVYEYYSLLDSSTRKDRFELVNRYFAALSKLSAAEAAGDLDAAMGLGADFIDIARGIEAVGDHYYAGQAWLCYARTQDDVIRGDAANFDQAAEAYLKVVEHREAIELNDPTAEQCRGRYETLKGDGYGPEAKADREEGGEDGAKPPVQATGDALTVDFQFRILQAPDEVQRPNWSADVAYNSWNSIYMKDIGSRTEMASFPGARLVRTGIQSFEFISGSTNSPAEMNGKFVPVEVMTEVEGGKRPWGFMAITGTKEDYYQGIEVNREPSPEGITVFVAPAARIAGTIAGVPVEIFDDSMSGAYGDAPTSWAYVGVSPGHFQWELDSIRIDSAKRALPWSRIQQIGADWYDMKVTGHQVQASPVAPKTGELKLKFKGPKPSYVILKGTDGLSECYYDIAGGKAVEVPVGRYELFCGFIAEGKRTAVKKVTILPGDDTPKWKVEEGKATEVLLGGPFGFDFDWEDQGETVKLLGSSLCVTGVSDERYERPWNCRPYPMASLRKEGSRKGGKPEKLQANVDVNTLYQDWGLGWHPQDLELPKGKAEGDGFEIQVTEKKNALFGKVESAWKGNGE